MNRLMQIPRILVISLKSLPLHSRQAIFAVMGFTGIALVLAAILSIVAGLNFTLASAGAVGTALVLSQTADDEQSSSLSVDQVHAVEALARDSPGFLNYSVEFVSVVNIPKISDGVSDPLIVRGLKLSALKAYPHFRLLEGRLPRPGLNELLAGRLASIEYRWLTVGALQHWGHQTWQVVGIFTSDHDVHESELWTGLDALRSAYNAGNSASVVRVKFSSQQAFSQFRRAVDQRPTLTGRVRVINERAYYEASGHFLSHLVLLAGAIIFALMSISAFLGTLNIMLLIFKARIKDAAIMQALGFDRVAIAYAYVLESLIYGLVGSLIGAALSWFLFNGRPVVTSTGASQIAFEVLVRPTTIFVIVCAVLLIAVLAGVAPAIKAMHLSISPILRSE